MALLLSEQTVFSPLFRIAEKEQDPTGDEALAERVREGGDRAAFALLVTRYRARVVALARQMLAGGSAEEAEDVAQETFLAAYEKRRSYERGRPFRPWLYKIAVNRCLDRLRALGRSPVPLSWDTVAEASSTDDEPLRLFLTGPFFVLVLAGCAAVLALGALLLRRLGTLTTLGTRAATRLEASPVIPTLWGLAAGLLVFLLAALLFGSHTLALLGVLVLAAGLALAGLGRAAAALSVGTRLAAAFGLCDAEAGGCAAAWTLDTHTCRRRFCGRLACCNAATCVGHRRSAGDAGDADAAEALETV